MQAYVHKKWLLFALVASIALFFVTPFPAVIHGQALNIPPAPTGQVISIDVILLTILTIIWPVIVTVIIVFFILAGFKFLTAQGNPEDIKTARRFLIWATMGVIVIILAFSIITAVRFTFNL